MRQPLHFERRAPVEDLPRRVFAQERAEGDIDPIGKSHGVIPMVKVELPAFDTLRYLAEHDPERLEHLRLALTELLISRSPEESRQRLRGLQFQVNARINLAPNPVAACIAVSSMMHDTLDQLQQVLTEGPDYPPPAAPARVLPFRPRPIE